MISLTELETIKPDVDAKTWDDYIENVWPKRRDKLNEFEYPASLTGYQGNASVRLDRFAYRYIDLPKTAIDEEKEKEFKDIFYQHVDHVEKKLKKQTLIEGWQDTFFNGPRNWFRILGYPTMTVLLDSLTNLGELGHLGAVSSLALIAFNEGLNMINARGFKDETIKKLKGLKDRGFAVRYFEEPTYYEKQIKA